MDHVWCMQAIYGVEAVATELLERAAEASASVHAAGKDGWLGKVGRGDVRRREVRERMLCSGLTG